MNATYQGITSPAISVVVKDSVWRAPEPQVPSPPRQPKPEIERPRPPDIRENLRKASAFYEEGKYPEAVAETEHAIRLDPESKAARSLRVRIQKAWEAEKKLTGKNP